MDHDDNDYIEPDVHEGSGYILTSIAKDIETSIAMVEYTQGAAITLISGAPGSGKTKALLAHLRTNRNALLVTAVAGENRELDIAASLCASYAVESRSLGLGDRRRALAGRIGSNTTLIIDEAQHLSNGAIDWVRGLIEEVGCGLVLSGDDRLGARMKKLTALASRIIRPVVIEGVSGKDAALLATSLGVQSQPALDVLRKIAPLDGGLRNIANVVNQAGLYAGNDPIEAPHVTEAIKRLRLGSAEQ